MLEAINKMFGFYRAKKLDMFKDAISLPGLAYKMLMNCSNANFSLFEEEDKQERYPIFPRFSHFWGESRKKKLEKKAGKKWGKVGEKWGKSGKWGKISFYLSERCHKTSTVLLLTGSKGTFLPKNKF